MATIIKSNGKYAFISDCKKINGKWVNIVSWSENEGDGIVFPTGVRAEDFMTKNNIDGNIFTVKTPPIHWYHVSEETGEQMGIEGKENVYFITANIGKVFEDGEWVSTDEGFIGLQDFVVLTKNDNLLEIAKKYGAFLDDEEWFFSSESKATKFASFLEKELENNGIEIVKDF